jgi:hypothetical protein
MKLVVSSLALAAALVTAAPVAHALDVINQDGKAYKLTVKTTTGSTSDYSLRANGSVYGLCNDSSCTIILKGGNSLTAGKDEKLIINGGKLKKWL